MSPRNIPIAVVAAMLVLLIALESQAQQQTTVTVPRSDASSGFSENIGTAWGVNFPGGFFNFNPGGIGSPLSSASNMPVGGLRGGIGFGKGNINGQFQFVAAQGARAGINGNASSVTLTPGATGHIFHGQVRPFVVGLIPVVGDFPRQPQLPVPFVQPTSGLRDRLSRIRRGEQPARSFTFTGESTSAASQRSEDRAGRSAALATETSSAELPAASLAEIRRRQKDQEAAETAAAEAAARQLAERAEQALAEGKVGVAKIYLRQAIRAAQGKQRESLIAKLRTLSAR